MHRSRIAIVLIDHPEEIFETTLAFWAGAVGEQATVPQVAPIQRLGMLAGSLGFEVQRTGSGTPSRMHLDIETDDIPAEVERLAGLGATIAQEREGITVMRDPGGLLFCVIGVQTDEAEFDKHARTWP
jgi:Glyoxalase-like domain